MKSIVFIFAILISSFHSLSAQSLYYYGYADTRVYKADTLGNVYWVKNFAGKIDQVLDGANRVEFIYEDSLQLFVVLSQVDSSPPLGNHNIPHAFYSLDTSGNIINTYRWNFWTESVEISRIIKSFNNGYWLEVIISSGLTQDYLLVKLDSTGSFDTSASIFSHPGGVFTNQYVIPLPDSTYFISLFWFSNLTGGVTGISNARISDTGNLIWNNSFSSSEYLAGAGLAVDSFYNIYITGNSTFGLDPFNYGIITDSTGIPSIALKWPLVSNQVLNHGLFFRNDSLFGEFHSLNHPFTFSEIYFDQQFHSACLSDSVLPIFTSPFFQIHPFSYPNTSTNSLMPVSDTITFTYLSPPSTPIYPDYCQILTEGELSLEGSYKVFPNPATDKLSVNFSGNSLQNISIYNITGTMVFQASVQNEKTIDVSTLPNGLYFMKVDELKNSIRRRFIIHR